MRRKLRRRQDLIVSVPDTFRGSSSGTMNELKRPLRSKKIRPVDEAVDKAVDEQMMMLTNEKAV